MEKLRELIQNCDTYGLNAADLLCLFCAPMRGSEAITITMLSNYTGSGRRATGHHFSRLKENALVSAVLNEANRTEKLIVRTKKGDSLVKRLEDYHQDFLRVYREMISNPKDDALIEGKPVSFGGDGFIDRFIMNICEVD